MLVLPEIGVFLLWFWGLNRTFDGRLQTGNLLPVWIEELAEPTVSLALQRRTLHRARLERFFVTVFVTVFVLVVVVAI